MADRRINHRAAQAKYHQRNREKHAAYMREYRKRNPEAVRAAQARYRERHPDRVREQQRRQDERRQSTPERREANRAQCRRWKEKNRDRVAAYNRAYNAAHPRGYAAAQRAREVAEREANAARLMSLPIYAAAASAVGRGVPDRDDIISTIILDVLSGELPAADIGAKAPAYIRSHFAFLGWHTHQDIDAPASGHERTRLSDILAAGDASPA